MLFNETDVGQCRENQVCKYLAQANGQSALVEGGQMPLKKNTGSVATTTHYDFETEIPDAINRGKAAAAYIIKIIVQAADLVRQR